MLIFQFKFVLLWAFSLVLRVTITPFGIWKFDWLFDFAMKFKAYIYIYIFGCTYSLTMVVDLLFANREDDFFNYTDKD